MKLKLQKQSALKFLAELSNSQSLLEIIPPQAEDIEYIRVIPQSKG
jgi:hypothetical protein